MYARIDPCDFQVVVGLVDSAGNKFEQSYGPDYGMKDLIGGFKAASKTNLMKDLFANDEFDLFLK